MTTKTTADRIVKAIRARGSDAHNLRDAAHEACHAIQYRLHNWNRRLIDLQMFRVKPTPRIRSEALARAVERLVCEQLGVKYEPDEYLKVAVLEAVITFGRDYASLDGDAFTRQVEAAVASEAAARMAAKIIRLGDQA